MLRQGRRSRRPRTPPDASRGGPGTRRAPSPGGRRAQASVTPHKVSHSSRPRTSFGGRPRTPWSRSRVGEGGRGRRVRRGPRCGRRESAAYPLMTAVAGVHRLEESASGLLLGEGRRFWPAGRRPAQAASAGPRRISRRRDLRRSPDVVDQSPRGGVDRGVEKTRPPSVYLASAGLRDDGPGEDSLVPETRSNADRLSSSLGCGTRREAALQAEWNSFSSDVGERTSKSTTTSCRRRGRRRPGGQENATSAGRFGRRGRWGTLDRCRELGLCYVAKVLRKAAFMYKQSKLFPSSTAPHRTGTRRCSGFPPRLNPKSTPRRREHEVPYWQAAAAGLGQAATDLKVRSDMAGPDATIPSRTPAVYESGAGEEPHRRSGVGGRLRFLKPEIDKAIAQGIPVITVDSDSPTSKRVMFIGTTTMRPGGGGRPSGAAPPGQGQCYRLHHSRAVQPAGAVARLRGRAHDRPPASSRRYGGRQGRFPGCVQPDHGYRREEPARGHVRVLEALACPEVAACSTASRPGQGRRRHG